MEPFNEASDVNSRFSQYVSEEFKIRCVALMIPDVCQYISNIQFCMLDADESRQIIDDIRYQIESTREKRGYIVNSTAYPVGSLNLDSRTFAQKNIREWCGNVAKTNDSLYQILNIVLQLGHKPWDRYLIRKVNTQLKKSKYKTLKTLCDRFYDEIQAIQAINDFSKHNQNVFCTEKFSPQIREKVEYHLRYGGEEYKVSEVIAADKEVRIMKRIVDVLDYLFKTMQVDQHAKRAYAYVDTVEKSHYDPINTVVYTEKPDGLDAFLLPVTQTVKRLPDDTYTVTDVTLDVDWKPLPELELAECYKCSTSCYDLHEIGVYRCNQITVLRDNRKIGEYRCEDIRDQKEAYFHFKTYKFHAIA